LGLVGLDADKAVTTRISCGVDVYQAVLRLANGATAIRGANKFCQNMTNDNMMAVCSGQVNSAIYNMIFVIGCVAQAINDCADSVSKPAACVATVTGFVANLDVIAGTASSATQTCNLWYDSLHRPSSSSTAAPNTSTTSSRPITTNGPRLPFPTLVPEESYRPEEIADYQTSMVNCWIDTSQGAMFLIRSALIIIDSVQTCTPEGTVHALGQKHCAVDVIGLLGALGLATRFISLAVPACQGFKFVGDGPTGQAACAADVAGVAAGLFAAVAPGMNLRDACEGTEEEQRAQGPIYYDQANARRLRLEDAVEELLGRAGSADVGGALDQHLSRIRVFLDSQAASTTRGAL